MGRKCLGTLGSYLLRVAREGPFKEVTFRLKLKDKKGTDKNGGWRGWRGVPEVVLGRE